MVYANPRLSAVELPVNQTSQSVYESHRGGKVVSNFSSSDLVNKAHSLWGDHLSKSDHNTPLFLSVNLETPFALAAFLGANANFQKVYVPSSFNMGRILEGVESQHSSVVIIDNELHDLDVPVHKAAELTKQTEKVQHAIVAGKTTKGRSQLFQGSKSQSIDPYTLEQL